MEGSRLRILRLLQRQEHASVEQLSKEMELASATVRRHLDILQRDQLVSFTQVKKKTGRPEHTYYLTETGQETLPKNYSSLLSRLLEEMSSLSREEASGLDGDGVVELAFQRMAEHTVESVAVGSSDSLQDRIARATDVLEAEKFEPSIEESNGSVRISLHNCPFRAVALKTDTVCTYDRLVLSSILGNDVKLEQCMRGGDEACCYVANVPVTSA